MSPTNARLSVVVPVYNEIRTIRQVVARVDRVPIPKQIIIVDDGSKDGTRGVLERLEQRWKSEDHPHSTLTVAYNSPNRGKGHALRTGIRLATAPITIVQDGDLEYNPDEYPVLIGPIEDGTADVVYGSRFIGTPRRVLYFRHSLGNQLITTLSNIFTDLNLTDVETGYKAFKTGLLQSIPLREDRFGFEVEVTAKVARLEARLYEVPISYHGRSYAEGKKIGWKDGVEALEVILKYWWKDDVSSQDAGRSSLEVAKKTGKYNSWLFQQLSPHLGQRVVEIGSGIGNISFKLLDRERLVCTESKPEAVAELERRMAGFENVQVHRFDPVETPPAQLFAVRADTVLCANVLAQLSDDQAALRSMRSLVPTGGKLVILVPSGNYAFGSLDRELGYLRRYSESLIRERLEGAGFEVTHLKPINLIALLGWTASSRLLGKKSISRAQLQFFERLIPLLNLEQTFTPPLGLSLLVVGTAK